ncbi:MAG: hypothetical protein ACAH11_11220 [Sphingomonas sp.]
MDRFSFFFAFYGLILGLAATEVLGGFARFVRAQAVGRIDARTALLALLVFVSICATWVDAWNTLQGTSIDFAGLWVPVLIATSYYLAATVVFPTDHADLENLGTYYAERKRFVLAMLIAADILLHVTYFDSFAASLRNHPLRFWGYLVPLTIMIDGAMVALMFVRGRRVTLALLAALIFLLLLPYWHGTLGREIEQLLGGG